MKVAALKSFFSNDLTISKGREYDLPADLAVQWEKDGLVRIIKEKKRKTTANAPKSRRTTDVQGDTEDR